VCLGKPANGIKGLTKRDMKVAGEKIVFYDKQQWQLEYRGEVEGLVEYALFRRSVTEEAHGNPSSSIHLRGQGRAGGNRDRRTNNRYGAEEVVCAID
jgi:hypothetical protein